jgi:aspartate/methionine/tyrosine aminotransferase
MRQTRRAMEIAEFKLERYFAKWEFTARHLLCSSDAETWGMHELVGMADDECRALWNGLRLGYTESTGHPMLRREIAGLYGGLEPDDVLTFAGAEEAIFAYMTATLRPGDHAVVMWPAYQSLYEAARAAGAEVSPLRLRFAEGWRLDLDELAELIRDDTRVVVVNLPHNPTGLSIDRTEFGRLVDLCERRGVALFCDEVNRYGEYDARDRLPGACELSPGAASLGGLAKPFGLAGLRVGWIAVRNRALLRRIAAVKDYLTICSSAPSEILALIALRVREHLLRRNVGIATRNLALLDEFFARWKSSFAWVRPRAGLVAFPRLIASHDVDDFCARLVERTGVLLLPGSIFDHEENHFRVGFGREDMPEALRIFEAELETGSLV